MYMDSLTTVGDIFGGLLLGAGMLLFISIIGFILTIFTIICNWKCFVKMGEPGWYSIIPFFNSYVLFKHVWGGNGWMFLTTAIPFIGIIFAIVANWKMFKGFGKSTLFCLLGLVLTPICLAICAFDNSTFIDQ